MSNINRRNKHVFIHVPKTGGTSMSSHGFVGGSNHGRAVDLCPKEPDLFSWCFVRHPCDRIFSIYNAAMQHAKTWPKMKGTFADFVRELPNDWQVRPHALPQTHFVCDDDGLIVPDFVGRFENLAADWRIVCELIGVEPVELNHKNATERGPWEDAFTPELRGIVEDVHKSDYDTFGFLW